MEREQIDSLDKMQRVDHDTLVRVEGKLDNLATDMREMKDGIREQLADHETRIRVSEILHGRVDIDSLILKVSTLWDDRNKRSGFVAAWASLGGVGSALFFELIKTYLFNK